MFVADSGDDDVRGYETERALPCVVASFRAMTEGGASEQATTLSFFPRWHPKSASTEFLVAWCDRALQFITVRFFFFFFFLLVFYTKK